MNATHVLAALIALFLLMSAPAGGTDQVPHYAVHEQAIQAAGTHANPYRDCAAEAVLTGPDGRLTRTTPLFWDGGRTWRFRFAPDKPGRWTWKVNSPDAGLHGQAGQFECVASDRRGGLTRRADAPLHFQYQNGDPVWLLGDTAWALFTDDERERHDRAAVERYLRNRAAQGFNAVHAMLLSEAGWGNVAGPPWHDLAMEQLNPAYWQEVDQRLQLANEQGITVGLVLAWGEKAGRERWPWGRFPDSAARRRYARYIGARYSAYDVYFIVAGEWHAEVRSRRSTEAEMKREFVALGEVLRACDPHGRLIGIHPMTQHGSVREFHEAAWMDFGDYQQNYTNLHARILESRRFNKPVVNAEYAYYLRDQSGDGAVDKPHSATLEDIRHATWDVVMAGGYVVTGFGSTYFGGHRHPTAFSPDDPRNQPWEQQAGLVKQFFTSLEYWKLQPHDELLRCSMPRGKDRTRTVEAGSARRSVPQAPAVAYGCLAEPGRQYVVYARGLSKPVQVEVGRNMPAMFAHLFDPRTGEWKELAKVAGQDHFEFAPPDERDWVAVLVANQLEGAAKPTAGSGAEIGATRPSTTRQWDRWEVVIPNPKTYADPYRDVTLDATFTRPDDTQVRFWGFYDGAAAWRLRFMPDQVGTWKYDAEFSDGSPAASGTFECVKSDLPGKLAVHEPNPMWFGFRGGDAVLIRGLHVGDRFFASNWDDPRDSRDGNPRAAFLDWAQQQGYDLLSVASHYQNRNTPGRGRGWGTPRLWPLDADEYQALESALDDLAERRLLVYPFAGIFGRDAELPASEAEQRLYLRYAYARLGPYWNVLLNVAGPEPVLRGKPYLTHAEVNRLGAEIQKINVFGTPLSVHNRTGNDEFRDQPWLTYGTLQGPKTADRQVLSRGLLASHHSGKPLLAQETLWSGNVNHVRSLGRDYSDDELRKNALVIHFSAAALVFADNDGNSSSGFSGTLNLRDRRQQRHDAVRQVWDLCATLPFDRLKPRQDLVNTGYCLADPGNEYLVYLDRTEPVTVQLQGGPFRATWIDARRPARREAGGLVRSSQVLQPPASGDDWVLWLTVDQ